MQNQITILVPLWDRSEYTLDWIKNNYHPDYKYYFADGSRSDENYNILKNYDLKNFTYAKYPYDNNHKKYLQKIVKSISEINTPYVMICDNDDFINYKGIDKCLKLLNNRKDLDLVSGNILFIEEKKNDFFLIDQKYEFKKLNKQRDFKTNMFEMINPYSYVWYSIFKKDIFKKVWDHLLESSNHFFSMEIFHTQLSLILGNFKYVDSCTHLRRVNPISRVNKSKNDNFYFIKSWLKNDKYLNQHFNINKKELNIILRHYLYHYMNMKIKCNTVLDKPKNNYQNLFQKIYCKYKRFNLNNLRKFVNDNI